MATHRLADDLAAPLPEMGLEKKSAEPPPSDTWPSFPRCTLLGFGCSSSATIALNAKRLGAAAAAVQQIPS